MGKYFGTDGFRGEANKDLTAIHAFRLGRFLGSYYHKEGERCRVVIGKDTRASGYMLEDALCAGLTCSGADAYLLHVTTTASVAHIARIEGFDPERALMVGDSLTSDIRGGSNAGIVTCWINPTGRPHPEHICPDYTIGNLAELPLLLEKL